MFSIDCFGFAVLIPDDTEACIVEYGSGIVKTGELTWSFIGCHIGFSGIMVVDAVIVTFHFFLKKRTGSSESGL